VALTLRDGGIGDADGVANGVIVDPAGVVEEADAETTSSSGGGGAGCFIAAAASEADGANVAFDWWRALGMLSLMALLPWKRLILKIS
jgi:hypothetical protein